MRQLLIIAAAALLLASCKSVEYVPVPVVHNDTTYIVKHVQDSVVVKDSVFVRQQGDTVVIEKYHTRWRDRLRIDTIYQAKTDTIPRPYSVTEFVERELTWWQRVRLWIANAVLIIAGAAAVYGIRKIINR